MIPFSIVDPEFAKDQLVLLLREWYMHPNGQIPAYEWALGDVNPPVHAWAVWRVFKTEAPRGKRDVTFLKRCFTKLILNFQWYAPMHIMPFSSKTHFFCGSRTLAQVGESKGSE